MDLSPRCLPARSSLVGQLTGVGTSGSCHVSSTRCYTLPFPKSPPQSSLTLNAQAHIALPASVRLMLLCEL